MNVRLLRRVQKAILKHPDQFEMEFYFTNCLLWENGKSTNAGGCGTAGCIAGWAIHVAKNEHKLDQTAQKHVFDGYDNYTTNAPLVARKLLNLTCDDGKRLFYLSSWPHRLRRRYATANTPIRRSKVAVKRIEQFIESKGKV